VSSSLESAVGGGEDEAGGEGEGEESKKHRKPNANRQANMIVIGLVRRMVRATAMLAGSTVLKDEACWRECLCLDVRGQWSDRR
jgi:hypothetical protein